MIDPTTKLKRYPVEIGKVGVATEAWVAVWGNRGRGNVIIAAPTLQQLEARWEQITHSDLDPTIAQHVFICKTAVAKPIAGGPLFAADWT